MYETKAEVVRNKCKRSNYAGPALASETFDPERWLFHSPGYINPLPPTCSSIIGCLQVRLRPCAVGLWSWVVGIIDYSAGCSGGRVGMTGKPMAKAYKGSHMGMMMQTHCGRWR